MKVGRYFFRIFFVAFFFLTGPFSSAVRPEGADILAEVNRVPITARAVEQGVREYLRQIGHRELSPERMAGLQREILWRLIEEELVHQEGQKRGFGATEPEVESEVLKIQGRFPSSEAFQAALSKEKLTVDEVREGVRRFILIKKTWQALSVSSEREKRVWLNKVREESEINLY